jgi:outer membrane protein assembly factor BamB
VPVHPDTLPTLQKAWTLPASLAPSVTNVYAPRMVLCGLVLYIYDHHGRRLAAVEATSGKVRWHAPIPSISDRSFAVTPLCANEQVYVASDGYAFAFNASDGRLAWSLRTKGIAVNGLARSKHHLFLPMLTVQGAQALPGVQLWSIDARRGRVEWSRKIPGNLAYVAGDTEGAYLLSDSGVLLAMSTDRGDPKWQVRIKGEVSEPPITHKGRMLILSTRRKAGWTGTGLSVVDLKTGKLIWESKLASTLVSKVLHDGKLLTVEGNGLLTQFDADGKKAFELQLGFGDEPVALQAVASGPRVFVFSYHAEGHGYVRLIDLATKKVLATANALDQPARAALPAAKMLFLDGQDGDLHAFRLDKSQRPKRATVPPEEFAKEMLEQAHDAKTPIRGLSFKLAGLGAKALPAIDPALASANMRVVDVAARAVGLIASKQSVPALIRAVGTLAAAPQPPEARIDALVTVLDAIAQIRDGRAVPAVQKVLRDEGQSHKRRRAAYVALGAIGSPVSLAPIWAYRAQRQLQTSKWDPQPFTPSYEHNVEVDVETTAASWPELIRKETTVTVQGKGEQIYTAALSPYLGGYNDVWIGKSDLSGIITTPLFTGITHPESSAGRRMRLKKLSIDEKGGVEIGYEVRGEGSGWSSARPVKLSFDALTRDTDGDKLPDVIERRLHLCIGNPDCDGDGLKDSEDMNPLASGTAPITAEQRLYREAFFTFYAFLKRRGIVVVDPGEGPSFELHGWHDPVLSLRRPTIEKLRKEVGLHAIDYVSFGGPYPEGGGSGDALAQVVWNKKKTEATIGMDVFRSGENAVAYNVSLKKLGKNWVVTRFFRVWTTSP